MSTQVALDDAPAPLPCLTDASIDIVFEAAGETLPRQYRAARRR